jgi:hypothetical protein
MVRDEVVDYDLDGIGADFELLDVKVTPGE